MMMMIMIMIMMLMMVVMVKTNKLWMIVIMTRTLSLCPSLLTFCWQVLRWCPKGNSLFVPVSHSTTVRVFPDRDLEKWRFKDFPCWRCLNYCHLGRFFHGTFQMVEVPTLLGMYVKSSKTIIGWWNNYMLTEKNTNQLILVPIGVCYTRVILGLVGFFHLFNRLTRVTRVFVLFFCYTGVDTSPNGEHWGHLEYFIMEI